MSGRTWQFECTTDRAAQLTRLREIWSAMQPGDVVAERHPERPTLYFKVTADPGGAHGVSLRPLR